MSATKFEPIETATLQDRVFDVVHMFSEKCISAVPIVDNAGIVVNLYETVDIIVRKAILQVLSFNF
jgi:CBS-domain-containing membrane protein